MNVYSLVIIFIITIAVYSIHAYTGEASTQGSENNTKIQYYGCVQYETTVHCDPLHNNLSGFQYSASSSIIYELSDGKPFFAPGKYGKALDMRAPYREAIHFPNISNITFNDFTVSFWVKGSEEAEPSGQILSYTDSGNSVGWFFDMTRTNSSDQTIRFVVTVNEGTIIPSYDVKITPDEFHHIVGTFNGSAITVYRDGQLVGQTKYSGNYTGSPRLPLTIGSSSYCASCNRWTGILDDLRIYNKALDKEEISDIYSNASDTNTRGLIAHWTFDDQLDDVSGNGNSGEHSTLLSSMAFTPDGRLFISEKNTGQVRIMKDSQVLAEPFVVIDDYFVDWEQGILGIAVDPKFAENHFIYLYYTSIDKNTNEVFDKVVRFTEKDNKAVDKTVLVDRIFALKGYHSGGALAFGPDDKLYITVGDATEHPFAQDSSIVIGKILRINRDGTIPTDNPIANSPVYTIGHRNMYGIAFDKFGNGLVSENGDYHYDEINLIQKGGNYGFPTQQPPNLPPELSDPSLSIMPLRSYWDTIAPTQMIYYQGDKIPLLKDKFVLGTYQGDIYALSLDKNKKEIIEEIKFDLENYPFKPIIGISQSPDGNLYFGAYNIWKLNSTDLLTKVQYLFPIEINISSTSSVTGVQYIENENKIIMDIQNHHPVTVPNNGPLPISIIVKIPKKILDNVVSIVDNSNQNKIPFSNMTTPEYNIVTMQPIVEDNLQIAISGSSIAAPGELVIRG